MKKRSIVFIIVFCILITLIIIGICIKIQRNTEWIITQYGDNKGAQMMSFTIFVAPDWLMNNDGNVTWFTVGKNREILEELGSEIYWHNTIPNEVILH